MQAIVSVAIGLVLLLWTGVSAKLFLILVGIWLVLQGMGLFLSSRKIDPAEGERRLMAITGGIMASIGIVFVFWTDTGVVAISWLIGMGRRSSAACWFTWRPVSGICEHESTTSVPRS